MRATLWTMLALAGCAHEAAEWPTAMHPLRPGLTPPFQLTYNLGTDRTPAWLPDGSGVVYTFERTDRHDRDQCLALLPAGGGTQSAMRCQTGLAFQDSTDVFQDPAVAADGRIAFVYLSSRLRAPLPATGMLAILGPYLSGATWVPILSLPVPPEAGRPVYDRVGYLRWAGDSVLIFLGERLAVSGADTIVSGLEAASLSLGANAPVPLPGTAGATSLDVEGGFVYFTLLGDSAVYRLALGTMAVAVAAVFGPDTIVRDVQARGGTLVVVAAGAVHTTFDTVQGLVQHDPGGELWAVDLQTGVHRPLQTSEFVWFRHPALSVDGGRVVAEGRAVTFTQFYIDPMTIGVDTSVAAQSDLWVLPLP